jgi:chaperonin GroEL (HSP60 family)
VIRVGGATEVEVNEKKDRVDDTFNATRGEVEGGYLSQRGGPAKSKQELQRRPCSSAQGEVVYVL